MRCGLLQYAVDDAVFHGTFSVHEMVSVEIVSDLVDGLAGMLGHHLLDSPLHAQQLTRLDLDVLGIALRAAAVTAGAALVFWPL